MAPIVYEDIHLETWHNGSNKGNDKLKQNDQGTTNEARFDGSTGKHRNHEETNNDWSQVSQNEPRGIGKRIYVVGDSIVSGLNEKVSQRNIRSKYAHIQGIQLKI